MALLNGMRGASGSRARKLTIAAGVAFTLVLGLSACTVGGPQPSEAPDQTNSTTPTPSDAPPPTLAPEGDAAANLPYFDYLATTLLGSNAEPDGRTVVDTLVAGGFTKADMEVTFDRTNVDLAVDTLQWAVRWKGECLMGQTGPASDGYHGVVAPMLSTGVCLLGATRAIDW